MHEGHAQPDPPAPQAFGMKDVAKTGKRVGKEVAETTTVWVLSGALTNLVRDFFRSAKSWFAK